MKLHIEPTQDTPEVIFDTEKGYYYMQGTSLPEEVASFYQPILDNISEYLTNPQPETLVEIKMHYFNSASSKMIYTILEMFQGIDRIGKGLKIKWLYESDDDDMKESGQNMSDNLKMNFEFIPFAD